MSKTSWKALPSGMGQRVLIDLYSNYECKVMTGVCELLAVSKLVQRFTIQSRTAPLND